MFSRHSTKLLLHFKYHKSEIRKAMLGYRFRKSAVCIGFTIINSAHLSRSRADQELSKLIRYILLILVSLKVGYIGNVHSMFCTLKLALVKLKSVFDRNTCI